MTPAAPLSAHPCGTSSGTLLHDSRTRSGQLTWCEKPVTTRGYDVRSPSTVCPTCAAHAAGLDRDLALIKAAQPDHEVD